MAPQAALLWGRAYAANVTVQSQRSRRLHRGQSRCERPRHSTGRPAPTQPSGANLQAPTPAADLDEYRRTPGLAVPAARHPLAIGAAKAQREIHLAGDYGHAGRSLEDLLWNAPVGGLDDFLENLVGALDTLSIIRRGRGGKRRHE